MKLTVTLLVIVIAFHRASVAQVPATFQVRHYTTENGLPSNGIKGIEWDEETGFLWIATEAGIARFNGIDFRIFTSQNTPFITTERISFMSRNNQGAINAVDLNGNILRVRENNLLFLRGTPRFTGPFNPYLYGLIVSDNFLKHKINYPGTISYPAFFTKTLSLTDTSMIVIDDGQVFLMSMNNERPQPLAFVNISVKAGFKIGDKLFLLADNNAVFLANITKQTLSPIRIRGDERFRDVIKMKEALLFWENGDNNPIVIDHSSAFELLYNGDELMAKEICNVIPANTSIAFVKYSEEKKLLFIGTGSKGLIVINEGKVLVKKKEGNIDQVNAYYSQIELQNGNILTSEGDILGTHRQENEPLPIKGKFHFNAYTMDDSLLWYSQADSLHAYRYLHCYSYRNRQTVKYPDIHTADHFSIAYSNGQIYVANDKGLGRVQGDSVHYLLKKDGFDPYNMMEISPGTFIIAACTNLIRFNSVTNTADTLLSTPGNCIRTLSKFKDYLFIGTYGKGYYIYRNGKLKSMPLDKNGFLSHVHCFIADKYGYSWMSTNRGLFKARLTDLINAFEYNIDRIYYHYLGRNDGMDITEMNGGCTPCALQMQNGTLSFPTMDGLLWVDPEKAVPVLPYGNIYIDQIQIDNEKINADSLIKTLPANTKEILIRLGFSGWCNKENLYIDYDLNNSGDWKNINLDQEAFVHLYGLSHGDYDLRIRKMNGFGLNNYSYNEFHFHINTPWFQQWWFYLLLAFLTMGLGSLYVKLRTRQYVVRHRKLELQVFEKTKELQLKNEILKKNDTIKTRLISIISHDIITPLKFLTVAGKNLVQKKQLMSEEMQNEAINEITNTSQDLHLLSTNILNWIKYQNENRRVVKDNINVREKVNRVLDILGPLARQKQLRLLNNVDHQLVLYQYAEPLRILIYNLVMNAINFTENGNITISDQREMDHVIISVKDEGIGMTPEQIQNIMYDEVIISLTTTDRRKGHGLGYLIIKDLIKMIGAELNINSEKGKGTIVSIKIPTDTNA